MRLRTALAALAAAGTMTWAAATWTPAAAMSPLGPSATGKSDSALVMKVHRRWRRGSYAYYPRRYRYHYRPYYYSYYDPYYAPYYRPYYYPYYGGYYGPRRYGYGIYGPRFGVRIGF